MSCKNCSNKIRVDISSAGEVEFCDGCGIIPDTYDIAQILKKSNCRLGNSIRKVINSIGNGGNSVSDLIPFRVTFNTKLYRIERKENTGWRPMQFKDYPIEMGIEGLKPDQIIYFETVGKVKGILDKLVENYKYNKIRDYWRPINFNE